MMSSLCVASSPTGRANSLPCFSISSQNSSQPSLFSPTITFFSSVGDSASAASTCSLSSSSLVQTIILTSAALLRYTISFLVSRCVAGIAIAPSLCRPMIAIQNSYWRFRISITLSPFLIPSALKKLAAWLLSALISANVNVRSSSLSFVHSSARLSGFSFASSSTTSKPKLKLSGTIVL